MGIRPASIESLYRRRSIAQITRKVERCDLKAIHVMENHHGQSSTCHRLDLYIVNTSHGRIDQSPRRTRHAAHPVDLSTSRTMEQNVKQAAPRRCQRPLLDAVRLLVFLWHRQLRVASVNWRGPHLATLQALTLLRWVPGFVFPASGLHLSIDVAGLIVRQMDPYGTRRVAGEVFGRCHAAVKREDLLRSCSSHAFWIAI